VNLGVSFPVIACDRSGGPHNGNIYICWADKSNGPINTDVFMVKSSDRGMTWTDPKRVNDDLTMTHQYFPFVTVDQANGKVWMVYYDRSNYTDTNTDVFMAVSTDGGEHFSSFRVSESPFIPYSSVFYGHYIGLAAHDDRVIPVWTRMDEGEGTLMGALVNGSMTGKQDVDILPYATFQNNPNPFQESTFISFKLTAPSVISLELYDITGNLLVTLIDREPYSQGKYVRKIDPSQLHLQSGVYLIRLICEDKTLTRKTIFVN